MLKERLKDLQKVITLLEDQATQKAPATAHTKRKTKDPDIFTGNGSPQERQRNFETWEAKATAVLLRDPDFFDTPGSRLLYLGDILGGKAYEYIKDGLTTVTRNLTNPKQWQWRDADDAIAHLRSHYVILDSAQASKNALDDFHQGTRNYWSWKTELDEHMVKAKRSGSHKVELLRKFISPDMQKLVTGMPTEIPDDDYEKWSQQIDVFAKNLANQAHRTRLAKGQKPTTPFAAHHSPAPSPAPPAHANASEPIDLDRLTDNERQYRMDNKLCMACGEPGHWKEAHDPARTPNPLPLLPRQGRQSTRGTQQLRGRGYARGALPFYGSQRGRGGPTGARGGFQPYRGNAPVPLYRPQQWQARALDFEQGFVEGEGSDYGPTEPDTPDSPSRQLASASQSSKGQPLE